MERRAQARGFLSDELSHAYQNVSHEQSSDIKPGYFCSELTKTQES